MSPVVFWPEETQRKQLTRRANGFTFRSTIQKGRLQRAILHSPSVFSRINIELRLTLDAPVRFLAAGIWENGHWIPKAAICIVDKALGLLNLARLCVKTWNESRGSCV
jgi:hypothetical protein